MNTIRYEKLINTNLNNDVMAYWFLYCCPLVSYLPEALQLANRLKTFCLDKSDAVSLSLVNQLQSNFEKNAIQDKNKLNFEFWISINNFV